MKCWKFLPIAAGLAIGLVPSLAAAQDADTLTISGTFSMDLMQPYGGTVGADLAAVFANGNDHWWSLTLHGVTYSHDYSYYEGYDESGSLIYVDEEYITRVHAVAFNFQFHGADADVINDVLSSQLAGGSVNGEAFLELWNGYYLDVYGEGSGPYAAWVLGLAPPDVGAGVSFTARNWGSDSLFSADADGYPFIEPQRLLAEASYVADHRPGNDGALVSVYDSIELVSAGPVQPTLNITDGSVREGNNGTTRLNLTVTLSWITDTPVSVNYTTANGTALAKSDYTAASGTLTFQPGKTSRTISISVIGDRKREPNETFTVRLSNPVGATIGDGLATVTIVNDD